MCVQFHPIKHIFGRGRCYLIANPTFKPDGTNGRTVLCFSSISKDNWSALSSLCLRSVRGFSDVDLQLCGPVLLLPRQRV